MISFNFSSVSFLAGLQVPAVDFRPAEPRRSIGDRAVAIIVEVVLAVGRVATDIELIVGRWAPTAHAGRVPLDAPICEIHPEHCFVAVHRRTDCDIPCSCVE